MTDKENPKRPDDLGIYIQTEDTPEFEDGDTTAVRDFALSELIDVPPDHERVADDTADATPFLETEYSNMDRFEDNWFEEVAAGNNAWSAEDLGADVLAEPDPDAQIDEGDELPMTDTSWSIDDVSDSEEDDGGAEGPVEKETFEVDESAFGALDDDVTEFDEDVYETMKRMDLELQDFEEDPDAPDALQELYTAVVYIGPKLGHLADAIFINGRPVGIGDHLFLLGADGQFHSTIETMPLTLDGVDLARHDNSLFIGTKKRGALLTTDNGRTLKSLNTWFTEGFVRQEDVSIDECSTSFSVKGHARASQFRLFGLTGEGQLFASDNFGNTWQGPLLKGYCTRLAVAGGTDTVWALTRGADDTVNLHCSEDLHAWQTVLLPEKIHRCLTPANAAVVASEERIIVFEKNSSCPTFVSDDRGKTWNVLTGFAGIVALATAPDEPDFIAAAASPTNGTSPIMVSLDGGLTRFLAAVIVPAPDRRSISVRSLSWSADNSRRLMVVTDDGAYLIALPSEQLKH